MKATLAFPRRGWAELRLSVVEQRNNGLPHVLDGIPGVRVWWNAEGFEFHWTTWKLPAIRDVLELNEIDPQKLDLQLLAIEQIIGRYHDWGFEKAGLKTWQAEAVRVAARWGLLLLADDMGLGKTRSAAVAARAMQTDTGKPIVIVGPGYAREVWRNELKLAGLLEDDAYWCALASRDFNHPSYNPNARWVYCHYDIVHAWATHFTSRPAHHRPCAVIIDEAHWIKESKATRSKGAQRVAAIAPMRLLLTGTPIENRPSELWHLLTVLCGKYSFGTLNEFRRRYCGALQGHYGLMDGEPSNVEELRQRIAPIYLRRTLADIDPGLLPSLTRQSIVTSLTEAQRQKHDSIVQSVPLEELVAALVEGRAGDKTLKILARLRKLTSTAKLSTTVQHVTDLLEQGHSVVVFCWMRETVQKLRAALVRAASRWTGDTYQVDGSFSQKDRDLAVYGFQAGQHKKWPAVLVATYGTLREGVTLTRATQVVLHDMPEKPGTILQSEKRIHRMTQDKPCTSSWMLAENSIDTIFAKLLVMKADYIERTLKITAASEAVDEVQLRDIAPEFDAAAWAREHLERV